MSGVWYRITHDSLAHTQPRATVAVYVCVCVCVCVCAPVIADSNNTVLTRRERSEVDIGGKAFNFAQQFRFLYSSR